MPLPVSLREVVDQMTMGDNEWEAYINPTTGELVAFPAESSAYFSDSQEDFAEDREKVEGTDDFIALPDRFEIGEYDIMKRFCLSRDGELRDRLLGAIADKGAFRRFKNLADKHGIIEDWYRFRNEAFAKVAAHFLDTNGISYVDDAIR
jgi:hypothetical protein